MLEGVWVGGGWWGFKAQGVVVVLVVDVAVVHIGGGQLLCEIAVAGPWCERDWIKIAVQLDFDCCAKYSVVAVARLLREIAVIVWRDCCGGRDCCVETVVDWVEIAVRNFCDCVALLPCESAVMCLGSCRGGMGTRNVKAAAASFSAVVAASSSPPLFPWPPPLRRCCCRLLFFAACSLWGGW